MMADLQFRIILNLEHCLMGGKGRFGNHHARNHQAIKKPAGHCCPAGF
ncbi:hypothetical protein G6L63_00875 [Agrobacterium vitis]|nr:hypothetical protein [Agrobacterium vitis]MUZ98144.1 hypothetical protein [Agrobacterium vitis]MVA30954.1 hypothetical protein [Agrobacterium vitis]NOJ35757.1 hypothetical protein [Agrobacterium vitis]NSZ46475.1 hypothetical protein [Agrobacterium vitis]UJL74390.1 hypothetical protein AVCG412_17240 [Agrobacterium vitis]